MTKTWIIVALLLTAASTPPTADDIGPEPAFASAVAMAEQAVRARLTDPGSAQFEWPYGFSGGSIKGLFTKRSVGWVSCGRVNAKNRMGGYTGQAYFQVVIRNGTIEMLDVGDAGENDPVGMSCEKWVRDGFLRPVAQSPAAPPAPVEKQVQSMAAAQLSASTAAAHGGFGVTILASPVGAILMAVAPGSKAEAAGLKAGETIGAINGIPVAGMETAAVQAIMKSPAPVFTLSVIGVGDVKLVR